MSYSGRLAWADAAKGICMVLVVMVHVHHKHYLQLDWEILLPIERIWSAFHLVLTPLRIPLFFVVSGMLAASAVARPWRDVVVPKVVQPAYLYVLWMSIAIALYGSLGSSIDGISVHSLHDYMAVVLVPSSSLWYLYALAVYFVCAKALSRLPVWLVLVVTGLISVGAYAFAGDGVPARLAQNLVFFISACYMPGIFQRVGRDATPRTAGISVVSYGLVVGLYLLGLDRFVGIRTVAAFVAVWAGINVVAVLSRVSWFRTIFGYVGRNTLPIYVMHVPLLAILACLVGDYAGGRSPLIASIYPVFVGGMLIGISLLFRTACVQIGAGWLFSIRRRGRTGGEETRPMGECGRV
ncbi:acyltransferase family protein [Arthrobacter citreus]|uniref:acyltransferase family protein n=1 Tax=Arthrobacter citreus TaxID=1670 RepID=UPI003CCAEE39